jgi:hypothetical protein
MSFIGLDESSGPPKRALSGACDLAETADPRCSVERCSTGGVGKSPGVIGSIFV